MAHNHFQFLPHVANCSGTDSAALFACALLTSYLGLFVNFYIQTYQKPAKGKKAHVNGNGVNGNGHASTGYDLIMFIA